MYGTAMTTGIPTGIALCIDGLNKSAIQWGSLKFQLIHDYYNTVTNSYGKNILDIHNPNICTMLSRRTSFTTLYPNTWLGLRWFDQYPTVLLPSNAPSPTDIETICSTFMEQTLPSAFYNGEQTYYPNGGYGSFTGTFTGHPQPYTNGGNWSLGVTTTNVNHFIILRKWILRFGNNYIGTSEEACAGV